MSQSTIAGPLSFQRTYASLATTLYTTTLGYGWANNQDTRLIFDQGVVWFKAHYANQYQFYPFTAADGSTDYAPYPGVLASLAQIGSNYVLTASTQAVYTFDSSGLLTSWRDANGHGFDYAYTSGRLVTVTEPISLRWLHLGYDGQNRISSVSDQTGRQVGYSYNGSGDLVSATDVLSQTWTYTYTSPHLLAGIIDPRTVIVSHIDYDANNGNRAWRQFVGGQITPAVQLTFNNGTTAIQDSLGNVITHTYDTYGTLVNNAGMLGSNTTKSYDQNFRPSVVVDSRGNPVTMTWSANGSQLLSVTDPISQGSSLSYDSLNNLTQVVDARNQATNFVYSGTLLTSKTDALLHTTLYTYTTSADAPMPVGLLKASSDPLGRTTSYQYDSLGQLNRITDPAGVVTTYGYDNLGRVITTTAHAGTALQQTAINVYDNASRLTQTTLNYTSTTNSQNYLVGGSIYNQITSYGYDQVGNQTFVTDTLSHVTKTEYDLVNRPVTVTVNYNPNASGPDLNIQSVTQYDQNGNPVSVTHYAETSLTRTTVTLFDALNRPISSTANFTGTGIYNSAFPDQNVTTLTAYDAVGNVISTTQFYGSSQARTTTTSFDPLNEPVNIMTNFSGSQGADQNIQSLTGFDPNGNVVSTTQYANIQSLARTSLTQYDPVNRPVTMTTNSSTYQGNDTNLQTVTVYNNAGQVTSVTQGYGTSLARTTYTEYDSAGRPATTTHSYDGTGIVGTARNLMQVTVYGPAGERTATAERRVYPDNSTTWITTTYAYNNQGQLIQTTYPLTNGVVASTTQAYDPLGRVITTTDALGRKTYTQFDALGRPMTVTVNYVDGVFNPNKPDEDLITVTSYDAAGNRVTLQDPRNVVTKYQYDFLNRLTAVTENYVSAGPTTPITNVLTIYTYTVASTLANIQDGRGKVSGFTYDLLNRQMSATDPLAHTTVYTYNGAGDRIALLDANGQVTNYNYDLLDRQTSISYPAGTPNVAFGYDVFSQRTVMTDGTGTTGWSYDAVGRPLTITEPTVGSVSYGYDSAGDRTRLSYPDSKVVNYAYDLATRLTNVNDWQSKQTTYTYNALGQPTTAVLPNGVTSQFSYDQAARLANISHGTALQTLGAYTYTVDAAGNRSQLVETQLITATAGIVTSHNSVASGAVAAHTTRNSVTAFTGGSAILAFTRSKPGALAAWNAQTIAYSYDNLYRLTRAAYSDGSYFAYGYDAVGNILTKTACLGGAGCTPQVTTYVYDDANRLSSVGGVTYTWDNNGNLKNDGVFTYSYDDANRLITVTNGITTTGFTYNGLGVRVAENDGGVVTNYTVDLAAGLTQVLADGAYKYVYGNGRIAQYAGTSAQYSLDDGLGSVRQLTDASGAVTLARGYEPYGSVLSSIGPGTTSYGFAGEWTNSYIKLIDLRARWLDPATGRFLNKDTWPPDYSSPLSLNGWTYVLGDPINYTDPSGRAPNIPTQQQWQDAGGWPEAYYPQSLDLIVTYRNHIVAAAKRHGFIPQATSSATEQQVDILYTLAAIVYQEAHGQVVDRTKLPFQPPDPDSALGSLWDRLGLPRTSPVEHHLAEWGALFGRNTSIGICQIRPDTTGREIEQAGLLYDPGTFDNPNTVPIPYVPQKPGILGWDPEAVSRVDRLDQPLWGIEYAAANMQLATLQPSYSENWPSWAQQNQNMEPWEKMTGWYAKGHFDITKGAYGDAGSGDIRVYIDYTTATKAAIRNLDLLDIESIFRRGNLR